MLAASHLKYFYLAYFSKPVRERQLYRQLRKLKPKQILEIGVGDGLRTQRLISVALRYQPEGQLRIALVDLFEGRGQQDAPGMSLKDAHRTFKSPAAKVQLIPGDPWSALARTANSLMGTDLILIAADQDPASLERSWFYMPRMLHPHSRVAIELPAEAGPDAVWQWLTPADCAERAAPHMRRRAA